MKRYAYILVFAIQVLYSADQFKNGKLELIFVSHNALDESHQNEHNLNIRNCTQKTIEIRVDSFLNAVQIFTIMPGDSDCSTLSKIKAVTISTGTKTTDHCFIAALTQTYVYKEPGIITVFESK